ncbi:hypothetical protein ACHAXA_001253 [Cyclostephanos tholiformis]|uniref:Helicase-associated domain-containing protein n=1 Tax=Cyclostephanos tholiformis TaxID=382380 RepID=A0ABD3R9L1_9STRA
MAHKIEMVVAVTVVATYLLRYTGAFQLSAPMASSSTIVLSPTLSLHKQSTRRRKILVLFPVAIRRMATSNLAVGSSNDEYYQKTTKIGTNLTRERLYLNRIKELHEFRSYHGHGSIPTPYPPNPSLGVWAANVRQQYALWKQSEERGVPYTGYLTSSRRRQLSSAGFDFTSLTERQFQLRLQELKRFKERYGHCMVPEKWEENLVLGAWVSNIRSLYKKRRQQQLVQSGDREESEYSPVRYHSSGTQKQRRRISVKVQSAHKRLKRQRSPRFSHLDETRIHLLENMGFVWNSIDKKWFEMLEWAKVYGVVNYQMKLSGSDGLLHGSYDVQHGADATLITDGERLQLDQNATEQLQRISQNRTLLLNNYHKFVRNIQNQSLLPSFHPQDKILALLLEETYAQDALDQNHLSSQKPLSPSQPKNDTLDYFQSTFLDYRIRPNDTLHQPLRIWMINQRSNYNRLDHSKDQCRDVYTMSSLTYTSPSIIPSYMTSQRQQALEAIHFPWSGRFRNRVEEIQDEAERLELMKRQRQKIQRIERKEREERERIERLTSPNFATFSNSSLEAEDGMDIMALWDAEDDEDNW